MFALTHQSEGSASLQRRNQARTSSQSRGSACYRLLLSDQTGGETVARETERKRKSTPCRSICAFGERENKKNYVGGYNSYCCVDSFVGLQDLSQTFEGT